MANLFDYLDWRDIDLRKTEFNEVDNLILARLSYFPLDGLTQKEEDITIEEAYHRFQKQKEGARILQKEDLDLFPRLAQSIRFKNLTISNYVNYLSPEEEKQFSAVTVHLPDQNMYVAYRGTDNTIVGWKEDFNMSFQELVPSQLDSVQYLEQIAIQYPEKHILIGGHSKGGNLAVYAAAFCSFATKSRVNVVYNNDGPGFHESIINSQEYQEILPRIHTFLPQSSIIGRLLNHKEQTTILKSTQTGIMQHDLYTWQVMGDHFVEDQFTNSSEFIDHTITNWLKEVSPEQRGKFIDTLFEILNATQAQTLSEMGTKWFSNAKTMLKTYQKADEESKEIVLKTLSSLFHIAKSNIHIPKPKMKAKPINLLVSGTKGNPKNLPKLVNKEDNGLT